MSAITFPLTLPAVRVSQPLGDFFVVSIPADTLRSVTYLDPTRILAVDKNNFIYSLLGSQREASVPRAKKIAKYIDTVEAAFPNSIILAANYINDGEFQLDDTKRWRLEKSESGYSLVIPSIEKMASVIDGQHRLLGFDYCSEERKGMELLCSVYMDLPQAYQAYLFATININQRKVDKSLAYEQFGYNLDDEANLSWSPDKCAVFLTRRLNLDKESPFYRRIKIVPLDADLIFPPDGQSGWMVSTACVVEGIISLISTNPKGDRDSLHKHPIASRKRTLLPNDQSPLRSIYLTGQDEQIFSTLKDFFGKCNQYLWINAPAKSYVIKTIGIQAQFDVAKRLMQQAGLTGISSLAEEVLEKSKNVNFCDSFFQALGKGRGRVRNTILLLGGIIGADELPAQDISEYKRVAGLN
jgi:DNA phosphorothioation-associated DGQHR protein 1